jgi:large subunit ribosomal protein LP2
MKHIAAYALLVLGGKESPSADDVEKLVKEAGCKPDPEKIKQLIEKMNGKKFDEVATAGLAKLSTMGTGAPAAGGASAAAATTAEPEKKVEKVEEEEAVDMGGLFGDDDDDY